MQYCNATLVATFFSVRDLLSITFAQRVHIFKQEILCHPPALGQASLQKTFCRCLVVVIIVLLG